MRPAGLAVPAMLFLLAACQPAGPAALSDNVKATIDSLDQKFVGLSMKGDFDSPTNF